MPVLLDIAPRTTLVDLVYLGRDSFIASAFLETEDGLLIVDPGPTVSMPAVKEALAMRGRTLADVRAILLTHIHLDHGGSAGSLVREQPSLRVYVHQRGAPHLVNPAKLLASATQLYGDQMDVLWGEYVAVPAANVHALEGGETLVIGGRRIEVAYTPGHASHHVSYLDRESGTAFVGDTCGEKMPGTPPIPTTPPPDIDLGVWRDSLARIRAWKPAHLFVTHFGPVGPVDAYLDEHNASLEEWALIVRRSLDEPGSDEERATRFGEEQTAAMQARCTRDGKPRVHFDSVRDCWYGLARYWRKHGGVAS